MVNSAKEEDASGGQRRFHNAHDRSARQESTIAPREPLARGNHAEDQHGACEMLVRLDLVHAHEQVARNLDDHKRKVEDPEAGVEARGRHVQRLFKPKQPRVGNVGAVQKGDEVEAVQDGNQAEVALDEQPSRHAGVLVGCCYWVHGDQIALARASLAQGAGMACLLRVACMKRKTRTRRAL